MQRRLVAILAVDVVGYSRLMERDEAATLLALKARRRDLFVPLVANHRGRVVKVMGDGALVEFSSAVDAVQCAIQLTKAFTEANAGVPEGRRILLRIGVNLGDVIIEGNDLYGDGVNVAARLEQLAETGGICVSQNVYDQVKRKIDVAFEDMGPQSIKNISEPIVAYRVSLGQAAPSQGPLPLPAKPSIAVLPFGTMGNDPEQETFADHGSVAKLWPVCHRAQLELCLQEQIDRRAADCRRPGRAIPAGRQRPTCSEACADQRPVDRRGRRQPRVGRAL